MRVSSVGTFWFREPRLAPRTELVAVPRTNASNRRVFEVLPASPSQLPRGERQASTYATVAASKPARPPLVDDWF